MTRVVHPDREESYRFPTGLESRRVRSSFFDDMAEEQDPEEGTSFPSVRRVHFGPPEGKGYKLE